MQGLIYETTYLAIETKAGAVDKNIPDLTAAELNIVNISGTILDPERYWALNYSDRLPAVCNLADIIDSSGEWSALASRGTDRNHEFAFVGDPSGFAPIFYCFLKNKALIVSDTFNGVVQGVRKFGGNLSLNVGNYLTLLGGTSTAFNNLVSNATMANEISILGHNEALFVNENQISKFERSHLSSTSKITDYDAALAQGIEVASQTIRRFVSSNVRHTPLITLTGGVDSRMVLALLHSSGFTKEFRVWSMDPRHATRPQQENVLKADVEIASELRDRYGMRWMAPRTRQKISISFEQALAYHQSFNSNFAFTFVPANHVNIDLDPILTLRGGGGEIIRGGGGARAMSQRYDKYLEAGGNADQKSWTAQTYLDGSLHTGTAIDTAKNFMQNVLNEHAGSSVQELVDSYYRATRNRGHFGHARKSNSTQDRLMQVLANPYLMRAAELSSYDARVKGQLVIDLFERTDPGLRDYPFESAASTALITRQREIEFQFANRHGWQTEFDKRYKNAPKVNFQPGAGPGERAEAWDFVPAQKSAEYVHHGFNLIADLVSPDIAAAVKDQHAVVLNSLNQSQIPPGILVAKVASALDVFSPMPLQHAGLHYYTDTADMRIRPSDALHHAAAPYKVQ